MGIGISKSLPDVGADGTGDRIKHVTDDDSITTTTKKTQNMIHMFFFILSCTVGMYFLVDIIRMVAQTPPPIKI